MNIPGGWELILIIVVVMVLFGYKRLPDATRSLGQSMRIFKAEAKGLHDEAPGATTAQQVQAAPVAQPAPMAQPAPVAQPAPMAQPAAVAQPAPVAPLPDPAHRPS